MRFHFLLICCLSSIFLHAQELCDNGVDDDGDGRIDLRDDECRCSGNFVRVREQSIIPNPSFEEYLECPTNYSQMNKLTYWWQASYDGTTDFVHECNDFKLLDNLENDDVPLPPLPIPDGKGVAGIIDAVVDIWFYTGTYKEYVATVLHQPMKAGVQYELELYVGFGFDASRLAPLEVTIFGHPSREVLPLDYRAECPTKYGTGWHNLGSTVVGGSNEWVKAKIEFTPTVDIQSITIGPPCRDAPGTYFYYYLDKIELYRKDDADKSWIHVAENPFCDSTVTLTSNIISNNNYSYQWYKDGKAIKNANKDSLLLWQMEMDNGTYELRVSSGSSCQVTRAFEYTNIRKPWNWVNLGPDIVGCPGQTITLTTPQNEFERNGRYYYWSTGEPVVDLTVRESGTYWLRIDVVSQGTNLILCSTTDTVTVDLSGKTSLDLGPDRFICNNEPIKISSSIEDKPHSWSTGETGSSIIVNKAGVYRDTVELDGCVITGSVTVSPNPLKVDLGKDAEACEGEGVLFAPILPEGTTYTWSDYSLAPFYRAFSSGQVWLVAEYDGCVQKDTALVTIYPSPQVWLGNDTTLCPGETIWLDATTNDTKYQWSTGFTGSRLNVSHGDLYHVQLTNSHGCVARDTVAVRLDSLPVLLLESEAGLCRGGTLNIVPNIRHGLHFLWSDGVTSAERTIDRTGNYELSVSNSCGSATSRITISDAGICELIFPNVFTPNHDGRNDVFKSNNVWGLDKFTLIIYNRWGQVIFQTRNPGEGWNGKVNSHEAQNGTYLWKASYIDVITGKNRIASGTVMLIR
jgi:gliding motility-associated-like protein